MHSQAKMMLRLHRFGLFFLPVQNLLPVRCKANRWAEKALPTAAVVYGFFLPLRKACPGFKPGSYWGLLRGSRKCNRCRHLGKESRIFLLLPFHLPCTRDNLNRLWSARDHRLLKALQQGQFQARASDEEGKRFQAGAHRASNLTRILKGKERLEASWWICQADCKPSLTPLSILIHQSTAYCLPILPRDWSTLEIFRHKNKLHIQEMEAAESWQQPFAHLAFGIIVPGIYCKRVFLFWDIRQDGRNRKLRLLLPSSRAAYFLKEHFPHYKISSLFLPWMTASRWRVA